jgi:hypothetical protein
MPQTSLVKTKEGALFTFQPCCDHHDGPCAQTGKREFVVENSLYNPSHVV